MTNVASRSATDPDVARLIAAAQACERAGDRDGAELRYRAVLARDRHSFIAQHQLSTILFAKGHLDDALEHVDQAVKLAPRTISVLRNRGLMLIHAGRLNDALHAFACALEVAPDDLGCLVSRGVALKRLGRYDEAVACYDRALALDPQSTDALSNKGVALRALKRHHEALACYNRVIELRPDQSEPYVNRANLLNDMRRFEAALADYDRALELNPSRNASALNGRGTVLFSMRRLEEALASYDQALAGNADNADALNGRGAVLFQLQRHQDALDSFEQALSISADNVDALNGKATNLFNLARHEEALEAYDRALALRADAADSLNGRGNALFNLRRFDEAMEAYDKAIVTERGTHTPLAAGEDTAALARQNRSMLRLALGDYEAGWQDYECRRITVGVPEPARACPAPYWRGEDLTGKSIVVFEEQGLGDTLQFCRYLTLLEDRGATVSFQVRASLHRLLSTLSPSVRLFEKAPAGESFDYQSLLLSLPGSFCTRRDAIPARSPYLSPDTGLVSHWREKLRRKTTKVGVCWQGNPEGSIDLGRSIPLAQYAPLAAVPGVELISLQKNHGLTQIPDCGFALTQLGDDFDSGPDAFADTAAAIANLDLVITSDTSVAHLAGALGRPTWVILKVVPDWRWGLEGDVCDWYPKTRLYRQEVADDWATPISQAARDLSRLVGVPTPQSSRIGVQDLRIPSAVGELFDKITILEIKSERIDDPRKLANVRRELHLLSDLARGHVEACAEHQQLVAELRAVNTALWNVEDEIRECEARKDFGTRFIELARAVYIINDRRAAIKRKINDLHGSAIIEEKSYAGGGE